MDEKPGQIIRVERLSHAQMQEQGRQREHLSFDVRKQKNFEKGIITKVYSRNHYDVQIPGRDYPYTRVPTMEPAYLKLDQVVTMAFVGGNPGIPVILVRQTEKRPRLFLEADSMWLAAWFRYGVRMAYRFYQPAWDSLDPEETDSSITLSLPSGLTGTGSIVRTDADGIVYWASGDNLNTLNLTTEGSTGTPIVTDLGGEITSLCLGEITNRIYATVSAYVNSSEGDCAAGYAAGVLVAEASSASGQGSEDCLNSDGYRAAEFAAILLAANPADSEQSETWQTCYEDGLVTRYTEIYDASYTGEGCVIT